MLYNIYIKSTPTESWKPSRARELDRARERIASRLYLLPVLFLFFKERNNDMTKYRKACNAVLEALTKKVEPLMQEYAEVTSGQQNDYTRKRAGQIHDQVSDLKREAELDADSILESYLARLEKKAKTFSGKSIDNGDMQLLNSPLMTLHRKSLTSWLTDTRAMLQWKDFLQHMQRSTMNLIAIFLRKKRRSTSQERYIKS